MKQAIASTYSVIDDKQPSTDRSNLMDTEGVGVWEMWGAALFRSGSPTMEKRQDSVRGWVVDPISANLPLDRYATADSFDNIA
jgi:hypothetical protein